MQEALMAQLVSELIPVLVPIISGLISWGLVEFSKYMRTKTKNESANDAITHVTETISTVVTELEQTMVPAMKERAKDGKLDEVDRQALKAIAIEKVSSQIPDKMQKLTGLFVNSFEKFISSKIEKAVSDLKK